MHEAVANPPVRWRRHPSREHELLRLAGEVENEQPRLAVQLRGIAMHEASVAGVSAQKTCAPWWRRLRSHVWAALEEVGRVRAEREMLMLADRWEHRDPALAKQLRASVRAVSHRADGR